MTVFWTIAESSGIEKEYEFAEARKLEQSVKKKQGFKTKRGTWTEIHNLICPDYVDILTKSDDQHKVELEQLFPFMQYKAMASNPPRGIESPSRDSAMNISI